MAGGILSAEGVPRFSYGLATAGQIGNVGTKDIEFKIAECGDWPGARVVMKLDAAGNARVDLLPQAGARRDASEPMTWYLEKDVNADFAAKYPKGSEFRIMGGDGDFDRLEKRLISVVPTLRKHGTLTPPIGKDGKVGIQFINNFDAAVGRFLAKVAFNYLAWFMGPEFVLRPEFDPVRNFIRHGAEAPGVVLPILA